MHSSPLAATTSRHHLSSCRDREDLGSLSGRLGQQRRLTDWMVRWQDFARISVFDGNPFVSFVQVAPPSIDLCTPLSGPVAPPAYIVVGLVLASTTMSMLAVASTCAQLAPLLVERYRPKLLDARTVVLVVDPAVRGSITTREMVAPPALVSKIEPPSCVHVAPPSSDRNAATVITAAREVLLAGTGVNDVRIDRVDRQASHGQGALAVSERTPRGAPVRRLPHSALRSPYINDTGVGWMDGDGSETA